MTPRYLILLFLMAFQSLSAQNEGGVHSFDANLDAWLLGGGAVTFSTGYALQKKVPILTEAEIMKLDPLRINPLDRLACDNYDLKAKKTSDILLKSSAVLPFALLLDNNSRKDLGILSVMLTETILINNGITGIFKGSIRRKRPYVYNANAPLLIKQERNASYSFFSGHASNSAAYAVFAAKVFADNNPNSDWRPFVWGAAFSIPAATSFFRFKAGKHFPTDVVVGYAVGATLGWLIPELHL